MISFAPLTVHFRSLLVLLTVFAAVPVAAQSGKISGTVTDDSGESIPGVNVFVVETSTGATTNLDGDYTILNVSPGEYTLRISYIGYTTQLIEGVEVSIDQTTRIDVQLQDEGIGLEEVTVRAEIPVVQPDVSNSQTNVLAKEIEALPAPSVTAVVGLQAGVQGLSIRGSGSDEVSFQVNGLTLRDERNNSPYTNISLASVEAVQVQTGGFNAEYGNVRSGVVNVVTKEGPRDRYEADVILRYSPPTAKNFGGSPNDPDAYWIRPFIDPEVAFTGTGNGAWPRSLQDQYPEFEGWNELARNRIENGQTPMTPEALQQAFLYQHRKVMDSGLPDYDVDVGFGGPVPIVSKRLGDLRFYASYRREEDAYLIPLNTDRYEEQTGHLKVTSNLGAGMKLSVEGRYGDEVGTSASRSGGTGIFRSASGIASSLGSGLSFTDSRIFSSDYWAPTRVQSRQLGATFTHSLGETAFYEVRLNRFASEYDTNPGRLRDTTTAVTIGGVGFDEAPFGFQPTLVPGGVDGNLRFSGGFSTARDTSRVVVYNAKADFTKQLTQALQVKTGAELNFTESDVNYGSFDASLTSSNFRAQWDRTPVRAAGYAQSKLELNGMVANLGLRLDYFTAGGDWYTFSSFDSALGGGPNPIALIDTALTRTSTEGLLSLSPRLGVSFPVTSVSKLYFNYGHFRSIPDPNQLFLIEYASESGRITEVANPNMPLPKTVAYELGYEQSFLDQFLIRTAGYYKDVSNLPFDVSYASRSGKVRYDYSQPFRFEDVRGFELTLARNRGSWLTGFVNYTYSVYSNGYFGFSQLNENTTVQRGLENSQEEQDRASFRAVPRPFARVNLDFNSPEDFGPSLAGVRPLGNWRASLIGRWQDGGQTTYTGGGPKPGVQNNVSVRDFSTIDLRFTRTFSIGSRDVTFFADVFNLTNRRQLSSAGYGEGTDSADYLRSLHLPASEDYPNIPGSDQIGTFRDASVDYVPVRFFQNREAFSGETEPNAYYYERETGDYLVFRDGGWQAADASAVQEVLDSKAYIDMPNHTYLTFLGPRNVFLGLRISL